MGSTPKPGSTADGFSQNVKSTKKIKKGNQSYYKQIKALELAATSLTPTNIIDPLKLLPVPPPAKPYVLQYQTFKIEIHPDDFRDRLLVALVKALVKMGNRPSTPMELTNCVIDNKISTLGGQNPHATVSSRISTHFKRVNDHEIPRQSLFGRLEVFVKRI